METVTLTIKSQPGLFLEADSITPDAFAGKKAEEIVDLPVYVGREQFRLGDFFEVSGRAGATPAETKISVGGNAGSDLGTFMNGGEIVVGGDVDVHVATHAEGGKIVIKGNAKSRLGGQMVEGEIYVFGNIDTMMPGFAYRQDVDVDVDGIKGRFALYEGDLGERHRKRKGQAIYARLYQRINA
jgi:formylmethanofuran dehydrogenase subunit C